jgi:hypothetical protein
MTRQQIVGFVIFNLLWLTVCTFCFFYGVGYGLRVSKVLLLDQIRADRKRRYRSRLDAGCDHD